jgi:nucleoside-diphosphate-sugar epimerase
MESYSMSSLEGISVLVTGANGFLGNAIKEELHRQKARIVSAVWPPSNVYHQQANTVAFDLSKAMGWEKLDPFGDIDAIIHCAAILPGGLPDDELLNVNQLMTLNLLQWGRKRNISHFIFASTCRVYGFQSYPCVETSQLHPPDLYAVSKIACEFMVRIKLDVKKIPSCCLRISAPYGPGSKAETVIRRFLMNSSQGLPITVHGSGSRSQDFIYERDVARAFCMALAARAEGVFNLASAKSVSTKELAEKALKLFGRDPQENIVFSGTDTQEEYRGSFPIDQAFHAFGFQPNTPISDGLELTAKAWGLL